MTIESRIFHRATCDGCATRVEKENGETNWKPDHWVLDVIEQRRRVYVRWSALSEMLGEVPCQENHLGLDRK